MSDTSTPQTTFTFNVYIEAQTAFCDAFSWRPRVGLHALVVIYVKQFVYVVYIGANCVLFLFLFFCI